MSETVELKLLGRGAWPQGYTFPEHVNGEPLTFEPGEIKAVPPALAKRVLTDYPRDFVLVADATMPILNEHGKDVDYYDGLTRIRCESPTWDGETWQKCGEDLTKIGVCCTHGCSTYWYDPGKKKSENEFYYDPDQAIDNLMEDIEALRKQVRELGGEPCV